MVKGEGDAFSHYAHAINNLLGLKPEPNPAKTFYVEHVNLISSPQGKAIRKKRRWRYEERDLGKSKCQSVMGWIRFEE